MVVLFIINYMYTVKQDNPPTFTQAFFCVNSLMHTFPGFVAMTIKRSKKQST